MTKCNAKCNATELFMAEIDEYFRKLDFESFYKKFDESLYYSLPDMIRLIQMTMYWCEFHNGLRFIPQLMGYHDAFMDENARRSFTLESIKFLIAYCDRAVHGSIQTVEETCPGMYM